MIIGFSFFTAAAKPIIY